MKKLILMFSLIGLFTTSCKVAEMKVPTQLESTSQVFPVKGKQSPKIKREISFGPYSAKEDKNSYPWISNRRIFLHRKKGRQRLQFKVNGYRDTYEVYAKNYLRTIGSEWLKRRFEMLPEILLDVKDNMSGSFKGQNNDEVWDFYIANLNRESSGKAEGYLTNGKTVIKILPARELEDVWQPVKTEVYGYSLEENGKVLASVRTFSNGKVWFRESLDTDKQDVVACMAAVLLLKKDLNPDS